MREVKKELQEGVQLSASLVQMLLTKEKMAGQFSIGF